MSKPTADNAAEKEEEIPCAPERVVVKKMVSTLVNPKVTFVSLVGHAANGLHFSLLKSEGGNETINQTETTMPKPTFGTNNAALNRLEFDLNVFKTETAVQEYLKASNIAATRINKTDTHFVVPGVHEASLEGVEMVKGDVEGVTYWIGKLKAPAPSSIKPPTVEDPAKTVAITKADPKASQPVRLRGDDEESEEHGNKYERVFKAEIAPGLTEVVTKMDSYIARQVGTTTLDATLTTGEPSLPALWELLRGIEVTVQNIVKDADAGSIGDKIRACFSRGGELAAGLANLFVTVSVAKGEGAKEEATVARESIIKHFSSPAAAAKAADAGVVVKKSEPAAPAAHSETDLFALVQKAVAPLVEKVDGFVAVVEEVKKSSEISSQRLATLEEVRQERQSLPDDGSAATVSKSEKDKELELRKAEQVKKAEKEEAEDKAFKERQRRIRFGLPVK